MTYCERSGAITKGRCDRRSFRWVVRNGSRVLICCPKGKWNATSDRCRVGTRAFKILKRVGKGQRCAVGEKRIAK